MKEYKAYGIVAWPIRILVIGLLLASAMTWAGSTYDHPFDDAVAAGMMAPECAQVRQMRAGSLLSASLPDPPVCRSFFLYRASFSDAASDVPSYTARVMRSRVDEFQQLVGYTCLLWLVLIIAAMALAQVIRVLTRPFRGSTERHMVQRTAVAAQRPSL